MNANAGAVLDGLTPDQTRRALVQQRAWRAMNQRVRARLHRLAKEFDTIRERDTRRRGITLDILARNIYYPGLDSSGSVFMNSLVDTGSLLAEHLRDYVPGALAQARALKESLVGNQAAAEVVDAVDTIVHALDLYQAVPSLAPPQEEGETTPDCPLTRSSELRGFFR